MALIENVRHLTENERLLLQDFVDVMEPFEEVTNQIQGEKVVTSSLVIPAIQGIKRILSSPSEVNKGYRASLLSSVEKRLTQYETNMEFQLATTLDPRFKLRCSVLKNHRD